MAQHNDRRQVEAPLENPSEDKISFPDAPRFRSVGHARRRAMLEPRDFLTIAYRSYLLFPPGQSQSGTVTSEPSVEAAVIMKYVLVSGGVISGIGKGVIGT